VELHSFCMESCAQVLTQVERWILFSFAEHIFIVLRSLAHSYSLTHSLPIQEVMVVSFRDESCFCARQGDIDISLLKRRCQGWSGSRLVSVARI
jgi:hypothetical protein